jgi:hypothetical protein
MNFRISEYSEFPNKSQRRKIGHVSGAPLFSPVRGRPREAAALPGSSQVLMRRWPCRRRTGRKPRARRAGAIWRLSNSGPPSKRTKVWANQTVVTSWSHAGRMACQNWKHLCRVGGGGGGMRVTLMVTNATRRGWRGCLPLFLLGEKMVQAAEKKEY